MTLAREFEALLDSYVQGRCALDDVRRWLASHVQAVLDSDEDGLRELDGLAWLLISELDRGDRLEQSVRAELAGALASGAAPVPAAPPV